MRGGGLRLRVLRLVILEIEVRVAKVLFFRIRASHTLFWFLWVLHAHCTQTYTLARHLYTDTRSNNKVITNSNSGSPGSLCFSSCSPSLPLLVSTVLSRMTLPLQAPRGAGNTGRRKPVWLDCRLCTHAHAHARCRCEGKRTIFWSYFSSS